MDHTAAAGMVDHIADYTAAVHMAVDMVVADTVVVDIVAADIHLDCTGYIGAVDTADTGKDRTAVGNTADIVKGRTAAAGSADMAVANTVADYTVPVDRKGLHFADMLDMLVVEAVEQIEQAGFEPFAL